MELRQRVRSAASQSLHIGRKSSEDADSIGFWLCEGLKKKHVNGRKEQTLEDALQEWDMHRVYNNPDLHFMNESSGIVVPREDEIGNCISDRDVVRICTGQELEKLLEKLAQGDESVDDESADASGTTISSALSRLKKMGSSNPTLKMLQKKFEDRASAQADEVELMERYPEVDPVFESGLAVELPADTQPKCDICDVSWPDPDNMYRLDPSGVIAHKGCLQFAADIMQQSPGISSRDDLLRVTSSSDVNKPGVFYVTVHRAKDLPEAQLLGTQEPYARLSLLPWKEPEQTQPSEQGGRDPLWKSVDDNAMQFTHMYNSTITPIPLLEVDIWNANYLSDDQIACCLLDMTPLLQFPNIEAKRWFTLSSRVQAPVAMMMRRSTSAPRVLLSIKFVPTEGEVNAANEHKFRVHQLKSVGLAIPMCGVCDRVIVNMIGGEWGYRCERCALDVHKGCIMKAMNKCECKQVEEADASEQTDDKKDQVTTAGDKTVKPSTFVQHRGVQFRLLQHSTDSRRVGDLYVNFQGLHLCTKHCRPDEDFHARNVFAGDTYCRLRFDDLVYETSPVLKSADPMFMERVCFRIANRTKPFKIEVIDFNSDTCVGEVSASLFQLLQQSYDAFVKSNRLMQQLKIPLSYLEMEARNGRRGYDGARPSAENDKYHVNEPQPTSGEHAKQKGFALLKLEYVESKEELLQLRPVEDQSLLEREDKDVTVESLRLTIQRFSRILRLFQWLDAEYGNIIAWKNRKKSGVCLFVFVFICVFGDLEYAVAYVLYGIVLYMLVQLQRRLDGSFAERWVWFTEHDEEETDNLKLYRPLADLHVAVHEAQLSESTEHLLMNSQSMLRDVASSKMSLYVLVKYLPNDGATTELGGDTVFVPSGFDQALVGWTHVVEKTKHPVWRKPSLYDSASGLQSRAQMLAQHFTSKQRKDFPYRNFAISWPHARDVCSCAHCIDRSEEKEEAYGVDHHAYYFPVPQACRKLYSGRHDLAPWRCFPGLVQFDLCISLTGEPKETPDLVVASSTIALREFEARKDSTMEFALPLLSTPPNPSTGEGVVHASDVQHVALAEESDRLLVRVEFKLPASRTSSRFTETPHSMKEEESPLTPLSAPPYRRRSGGTSRAERNLSTFVCERLAEKEKSNVIGGQFIDTFWKVRDTMKSLQDQIGRFCGAWACAENLFNWAHPWKTAVAFAIVLAAAVVFSIVPSRWIVLLGGLSEFTAVFFEDLPPSNQLRTILWNFLSSLPTDQELIRAYDAERQVYTKMQEANKRREVEEELRLRHHGLWSATMKTTGTLGQNLKERFVIYRTCRFLLWKVVDDAEVGNEPWLQLMFESEEAVTDKSNEEQQVVSVSGISSYGKEEREFYFESKEQKDRFLSIVLDSCNRPTD